jgi:hypothetical protein
LLDAVCTRSSTSLHLITPVLASCVWPRTEPGGGIPNGEFPETAAMAAPQISRFFG